MRIARVALFLTLLWLGSEGFSISHDRIPVKTGDDTEFHSQQATESRRNLLRKLAASASLFTLPTSAFASGGATAGGAYLLSAKQRYNDRVLKGVTTFVGIRRALENGDIDTVREFFTSEDIGSWKDFSSAGYLLANAFRRSSSTPPDSLPSVQKWKAFAADVENMTKSLKKKDTKTALVAYDSALERLDIYLTQAVELPSLREL